MYNKRIFSSGMQLLLLCLSPLNMNTILRNISLLPPPTPDIHPAICGGVQHHQAVTWSDVDSSFFLWYILICTHHYTPFGDSIVVSVINKLPFITFLFFRCIFISLFLRFFLSIIVVFFIILYN